MTEDDAVATTHAGSHETSGGEAAAATSVVVGAMDASLSLVVVEAAVEALLNGFGQLEEVARSTALRIVHTNAAVAWPMVRRLEHEKGLEIADAELKLGTVDLVALLRATVLELSLTVLAGRPCPLVTPDAVVVTGDRTVLAEILAGMLRQTAARSPMVSPIEVGVGVEETQAVVTIRDHGRDATAGILAHDGVQPTVVDMRFLEAAAGIAVLRGFAATHGGDITVRDTPGAGRQLRLRLPVDGRKRATRAG